MLVNWFNRNLIIAIESIHEGNILTCRAFVNNLVNEGCRIVVFWTSRIQISIVNTHSSISLFLFDKYDIKNPFY